jgi:hypothetical protein
MDNYFDREILQMERELLRLKTSQQKFAGSVPTIKKSLQISVPLALTAGGMTARGQIYCKIVPESTALVYPTLAKYYDDVLLFPYVEDRTRSFFMEMFRNGDDLYLEIIAYGTNYGQNNDVATLKNGGSVSLTNTITVVSTDNFELGIV